MNKKIIAVATPQAVTYYEATKIAEELLDDNGNIVQTNGTLPDATVEQFASSLQTIKTYKNGLLDGDVKVIDLSSGRNTYIETYEEGQLQKMSDTDTLAPLSPDGVVVSEALKTDTFRKGVYCIRNKDGIFYYKDDKEIAKEILGPKGESMVIEGHVPDGPVKEYYESHLVKMEIHFKHNKPCGTCTRYDEAGRLIAEETYTDGKREGKASFYDYCREEKAVEQVNYANGMLEGKRLVFYPNGAVNISENYEKNKLQGRREVFYDNGILNLEETYKNDKLNGIRIFYHKNGAVWFKENYNNGSLEGERLCYFPSGELQMKENYSQGLLEGEKKIFDKDGTILFEESYSWGAPVNKRKR